MVNPIHFQNLRGPEHASGKGPNAPPRTADFASVFDRALHKSKSVVFSAHATQRLEERAIQLTRAQQEAVAGALDDAASKGARESLLLMDDLALVVSVPKRTVITAFEPKQGENSVVTNIDSVVIVSGVSSPETKAQTIGPDPFGEARVSPID